jgi:N-acetylglucosaminyl-diphospho-decaprenol L-rhamnosyltransferase
VTASVRLPSGAGAPQNRATPEVSAIVVNHRSAAECAECVRSLRSGFERDGISGEIVLVDCGSGAEEVERLARLAADVFLPLADNRGYSGGLNAGLARSRAEKLLLCNADVVFFPGAVRALASALEDPAVGAAAPRACWDEEDRLWLPAGEAPGFLSELLQLLAGRFPGLDDWRFAAFAREALRLWRSGGRARHLVGAVLAARREVFDRVGRFDERFLFEHEETEWEDRLRRDGLELRFVPAARIRHLWAVSASRSPESAGRREASRRIYREKRYGRLGRRMLDWAGAMDRKGPVPPAIALPALAARSGAWVAFSPNRSCVPFAGSPLTGDFRLPEEVAAGLAAGTWYLRVFGEEDGRPIETLAWEKGA